MILQQQKDNVDMLAIDVICEIVMDSINILKLTLAKKL